MELIEILSWPAMICLIIGLALATVEIFIPGFGVPGILGIMFLIAGVALAANTLLEALIISLAVIVVLGIVLTISLVSASRGRLSKSALVLSNSTARDDGFRSVDDMEFFLGREGTTTSVLRPAGNANFDGVKLDVVSDGEFIPSGARVRVMSVEGRRIVVRQVDQAQEA